MFYALRKIISAYDIGILSFIQQNRIAAIDSFFILFSFVTTFISIGLILILFVISIRKKSRLIKCNSIVLAIVFALSASMSFILKNMIYRTRPFVGHLFIKKLSEAGNSSFPSGHTLEAFAMATTFALLFPNKKIAIPIFLWAFLVAYSRIALGVHYPTDVLAGMLIGAIVGWVAFHFSKKYVTANSGKPFNQI
jgi:undecaprenyl-diphosphatase